MTSPKKPASSDAKQKSSSSAGAAPGSQSDSMRAALEKLKASGQKGGPPKGSGPDGKRVNVAAIRGAAGGQNARLNRRTQGK